MTLATISAKDLYTASIDELWNFEENTEIVLLENDLKGSTYYWKPWSEAIIYMCISDTPNGFFMWTLSADTANQATS